MKIRTLFPIFPIFWLVFLGIQDSEKHITSFFLRTEAKAVTIRGEGHIFLARKPFLADLCLQSRVHAEGLSRIHKNVHLGYFTCQLEKTVKAQGKNALAL